MILPTSRQPAQCKNPRRLLLFGLPKCGKTTAIAALPDCLIIDLEEGTKFVEAMSINVNSPADLLKACVALHTGLEKYNQDPLSEGAVKYKYIALDNLSILEDWANTYALNNYRATPQGKNFKGTNILELPQGGGYGYARKAMLDILNGLNKLCDCQILIGHVKYKSINKSGVELNVQDLDLTGKLVSIVASAMDANGQLYRKPDGKLNVNFKQLDGVAGSRCDHLAGQDFLFGEINEAGEKIFHWDKIFVD